MGGSAGSGFFFLCDLLSDYLGLFWEVEGVEGVAMNGWMMA